MKKTLILGDETYKNAFFSDVIRDQIKDMAFIPPKEFWKCSKQQRKRILGGATLVCFVDGPDINPELYEETKHPTTSYDSERDIAEQKLYLLCVRKGIPMVGIGRGAHLLTVMNGGKLIQNVSGHNEYTHQMFAELPSRSKMGKIRRQFFVNSNHHQMMYPFNLGQNYFKVVGHCIDISVTYEGMPRCEIKQKCFTDGEQLKIGRLEPEVVFYPESKCLAFQYNPHNLAKTGGGVTYFCEAVRTYLFNQDTNY